MDKETEQKIGQLQLIEQNLQSFMLQKQNFQAALIEYENALKEVEKTKDSVYQVVGGVMVHSNATDVKKELKSKIDVLNLRIKTIEDQEIKIGERAKKLQEEVMGKLKTG